MEGISLLKRPARFLAGREFLWIAVSLSLTCKCQASFVFKDEIHHRRYRPEWLIEDADKFVSRIVERDRNVVRELLTSTEFSVRGALGEQEYCSAGLRLRTLNSVLNPAGRIGFAVHSTQNEAPGFLLREIRVKALN